MEEKKIRVAITHGDTNGVGYELIFKVFADPAMLDLCTPIVYGSPRVAAYHIKAMDLQTQFNLITEAAEAKDHQLNLLSVFEEEIKVDLGQQTDDSVEASRKALKAAIVDVQQGKADVLVMAPDNLPDFLSREPEVLRIRMAGDLRVGLMTNQVALKDVPQAITMERLVEKGRIMNTCLRRDLRISAPRIAVLALNPPTGEEAQWGDEETQMIIPAVEALQQEGVLAFGPYTAQSFFGEMAYTKFDGVLAMYYDQGIAPMKAIERDMPVCLTTGMPFVCTSPETGVCYGQAGQGLTDEANLRDAIYLALDVFRHRRQYDEPTANPLPKLYREKRDESEKVRFRRTEKTAQTDEE